jgi:uncharacterized protein (DUF362 family)
MINIFTNVRSRLQKLVLSQLKLNLGQMSPKEILIKPNWVINEKKPEHSIHVLVTDPLIIEAVILACIELFPDFDNIVVADCPLQSADWQLMCKQSGLAEIITRYENQFGSRIKFVDLRKEILTVGKNYVFIANENIPHGDPLGYKEIKLKDKSHLEPIAADNKFSIVDHDKSIARKYHQPGDHRYLVSQSILNADLIINLPKWKTHSKTALTGALKNLVGISGDKAYLPHYSQGSPKWGGDEYGDKGRWIIWFKTYVKSLVWRRSSFGYAILKPFGKIANFLYEEISGANKRKDQENGMYIGGGGWYGNRTIWRMIYDLNMIVQCVDKDGILHTEQQRKYFCIVDGLIAGEGDGPLEPMMRDLDCIVCGTDPFKIDTALSWLMGFDPALMPLLSERKAYMGEDWGQFDLNDLYISFNDIVLPLTRLEQNYKFHPPKGWTGHIERD